MENTSLDKKALRDFGLTMAAVFLVLSVVIFIKHKQISAPLFIACAIFFLTAVIIPQALSGAHNIWMKLALALGWINTRIILLIIYYSVFTAIGLIMRLLGKGPLDLKIEKNKVSYWNKKEKSESGPSVYKRQF